MKKILFVAAAIVLLASCKGKNAVPDQTLLNTRWLLESIAKEKVDNSSEDKPIYLFMEDGSYQLTGYAGCNNFFGSFFANGTDELMFVGARPQLLHTRWLLDAIGNEKVENANKENPVYIELTETEEGNRVAGMAGCNRYFGEYALAGEDSLSLSKIGATRMMCDNMATETKYLKALSEVDSYKVDGLYMYFMSKDSTVLTYKADENSLKLAVAATLKACDKLELEKKIHSALAGVRKYSIDGLSLYLTDAEGSQVLSFKAFYEE